MFDIGSIDCVKALAALLTALLAGCGSQSSRRPELDTSPVSTSEVVMGSGAGERENILKGLRIAYDEENVEVLVAGTMHGATGVVALDPEPEYARWWQLGREVAYDAYEPKFPVVQPISGGARVWTVGMNRGSPSERNLFVSDSLAAGVLAGTYHSRHADFPATSSDQRTPVSDAVAVPDSGALWLATDDASGVRRRLLRWIYRSFILTGQDSVEGFIDTEERVLDMVWSEDRKALVLLVRDDPNSQDEIVFAKPSVGSGSVTLTTSGCTLTPSGSTARFGHLRLDSSGDIFVAGKGALARFEARDSGSCQLLLWTDEPCQNPTDMAINEESGTVALLYRYDEPPALCDSTNSGTSDDFFSWVDVYRYTDSSFERSHAWNAGVEAVSIAATTGHSEIEYAVGAGGEGMVRTLPADSSAAPQAVQLSTSPESVLLARNSAGDRVMLALSRLSGSQLIVTSAAGSRGLAGDEPLEESCYYGPETVGYWPVGFAKSRTSVFILSHFERKLRTFSKRELANCSTALSYSPPLTLEPIGTGSAYEVGDSISALASAPDGTVHVALLNVSGEMHFIDCRSGPCEAPQSEQLLSRDPSAGPGRAQAAVKIDIGTGLSTVFVLYEQEKKKTSVWQLEVWEETCLQTWTHVHTETLQASDLFTDLYAVNGLFYSPYSPDKLYVYNQIYFPEVVSMEGETTLWHKGTIVDDEGNALVHRVVTAEPDGDVWGTYFNAETGAEVLRKVTGAGSSWEIGTGYRLFPTYHMRSAPYMEYDEDSSTFDALFGQPHEGRLYYRSGL